MPFNPNAKPDQQEFQRELIPEGPHLARCARVIEIGKHASGFTSIDPDTGQEVPDPPKDKAVIAFSLPNVKMDFGKIGVKQAFISNIFGITISNNEKSTMYRYTKALDPQGEGENLGDSYLGKLCQITVQHKTRPGKSTIQKIDSISAALPGLEAPELDTTPMWYSWENPDYDIWNALPEIHQEQIKNAVNFEGSPTDMMLKDQATVTPPPSLHDTEEF